VIAPKRVISRIASAIRAHNVYHRLFRNPLFGQFVDENLNHDVTECDFYGTDVSIVFGWSIDSCPEDGGASRCQLGTGRSRIGDSHQHRHYSTAESSIVAGRSFVWTSKDRGTSRVAARIGVYAKTCSFTEKQATDELSEFGNGRCETCGHGTDQGATGNTHAGWSIRFTARRSTRATTTTTWWTPRPPRRATARSTTPRWLGSPWNILG